MQALILRVLVVDDSEVVRRGIGQILQSESDIEIICEAADGADAVRKAREHRPDVVLLDITMAVMNRFATCFPYDGCGPDRDVGANDCQMYWN